VPETQIPAKETRVQDQNQKQNPLISEQNTAAYQTTQKENSHNPSSRSLVIMGEKNPQKRGSCCLDKESVMVIYEEQLKEAEVAMQENSAGETGLIRHKSKSTKLSSSKKGKRFCPYGAQISKAQLIENTQLVETPIQVVEKSNQWALVASLNKPLNYP